MRCHQRARRAGSTQRALVGAGDRHQSDRLRGDGDLRDRRRARPADAARLDRHRARPYQEIDVGEGAIGRAAATGERLIRPEGGSLSEDGDAALTACIPLKVAGRVVGVLAVFSLLPHKGRPRRDRSRPRRARCARRQRAALHATLAAASDGMVERRREPETAAASALERPAGVSPLPPTGTLQQAACTPVTWSCLANHAA